MSGIRVGTRLEQLYQLRDRLALEIAHEERLAALDVRVKPPRPVTRHSTDVVSQRLKWMGVTARIVKQWALEQGLIDKIHRGRVSLELAEAYIDAHAQALQGDWAS